jgi:hypothetical protein
VALVRPSAHMSPLLDGDDYWTSPHKLRKQIEFLDSRPDCAICFHNVTVVYDGSREP